MSDRLRVVAADGAVQTRSATLALALTRRGARFLVVGGTARQLAGQGGTPHDLDLAVVEDDLPSVVAALSALGVAASVGQLTRSRVGRLDTSWGPLDVFVRPQRPTGRRVIISGLELRVDPSPLAGLALDPILLVARPVRESTPMALRTGLGTLEVAALRAVAASRGPAGEFCETVAVLEQLEATDGIAPFYSLPVLCDLTAWWRVHLRLLDDQGGNWGSAEGDGPAEARYTRARLSPLGELALASERGDVGPVPFGLIDGSLYKGGRVPPLDPHRVVATLLAAVEEPGISDHRLLELLGPPAMPTGGTVTGDLAALYAGESTWLDLGCRVVREHAAAGEALIIIGTPLGVAINQIEIQVSTRARADVGSDVGPTDAPQAPAAGRAPGRTVARNSLNSPRRDLGRLVVTVNNESTMYVGTRIVVVARPGVDLAELARWLHGVWPVTVQAECRLPAPVTTLLREWAQDCRADRSGLDQLEALLI